MYMCISTPVSAFIYSTQIFDSVKRRLPVICTFDALQELVCHAPFRCVFVYVFHSSESTQLALGGLRPVCVLFVERGSSTPACGPEPHSVHDLEVSLSL